jgi:RimJ/RimL family protein N-acetyltransferase
MADIHIRTATLADDADLARLDHDTWDPLHAVVERRSADASFFGEHPTLEAYFVAHMEDRLAGYLRLAQPIPLPSNAHIRQIQGLAVFTWARGRGVARALIEAALDAAREQGARRVTLRVLGHNAPARALYESLGFVVDGVLPGEFLLDGEYVDDVLMGRLVQPG